MSEQRKNVQSDPIKFASTRFGQLEVSPSALITIPGGIIGFADLTKYVLLDYNPPFSWLHSVEQSDLAFVVVNAAEFGDEYTFPLPVGDRDLDLRDSDMPAIMNLVSVRSDPKLTTVNLKAPIVVNPRTMIGKQVVLDNPRFPVRMPLWIEEEKK